MVVRKKEGLRCIHPWEKEQYVSRETKSFLEHFYDNSYQGLIASLVKNETISQDDIEDIVSIITENSHK